MLFAYRSGKEPISNKALRKLSLAEERATYGKSEQKEIIQKEIQSRIKAGPEGVATNMTDDELVDAVSEWLKQYKNSEKIWYKKAALENLVIFARELNHRIKERK